MKKVESQSEERKSNPWIFQRRLFAKWLVGMLLCFVVANVAGAFAYHGFEVKSRATGIPYTVAVWGPEINSSFDAVALLKNIAFALGVSALVALDCTAARLDSDEAIEKERGNNK